MAQLEKSERAGRSKHDQEIRVMPDGRVLFADDVDEGHNGAFYAGDKPLPKDIADTFDGAEGQPVPPEELFGEQATPFNDDSNEMQSDFASREQSSFADERSNSGATEPDFHLDAPHRDSEAEETFPPIMPQLADGKPSPPVEDVPFTSMFPGAVEIDYSQVEKLDSAKILGRSRGLSRNMGIGNQTPVSDTSGEHNFAMIDDNVENHVDDTGTQADTLLALSLIHI